MIPHPAHDPSPVERLVAYWAHRAWPPKPRDAHRVAWWARQGRVSPVAWRRAMGPERPAVSHPPRRP